MATQQQQEPATRKVSSYERYEAALTRLFNDRQEVIGRLLIEKKPFETVVILLYVEESGQVKSALFRDYPYAFEDAEAGRPGSFLLGLPPLPKADFRLLRGGAVPLALLDCYEWLFDTMKEALSELFRERVS